MNEKLEQIKAALRHSIELAEKATPGPWEAGNRSQEMVYVSPQINDGGFNAVAKCYNDCRGRDNSLGNAAFIAYARTFAPAAAKGLIVAIEGLQQLSTLGGTTSNGNRMAQRALQEICRDWPEDVR